MSDLYSNIKRLCAEHRVSILKMTQETGISKSSVYDLNGGRNGISVETATKIADYFGITVNELYSGEQKEKPPTMDGRVFELITICNQLTDENLLKVADYIRYLLSTQS